MGSKYKFLSLQFEMFLNRLYGKQADYILKDLIELYKLDWMHAIKSPIHRELRYPTLFLK